MSILYLQWDISMWHLFIEYVFVYSWQEAPKTCIPQGQSKNVVFTLLFASFSGLFGGFSCCGLFVCILFFFFRCLFVSLTRD